jgi:hypothetical protein
MQRRSTCLVAAVLAFSCAATGSAAAQRPNFSGTWIATNQAAPPTGAPRAGFVYGSEFAIRQDENTLSITRTILERSVVVTHALDGTETRTRLPARLCEGDSESIYVAGWDGSAVRISLVGTVPPGGGPVSKRAVTWKLRLDAPDTLTVDMVAEATGQASPRTLSTVYTRSARALPPAAAAPAPRTEATLAQLEWLGGVWVGNAGSSNVEERWTPPAGGSMLAVARSLRGGAMTSFEFLCIVERGGGLVYTAMPNGRQPPTEFTLTAIDESGATFENPAHDFPKKIRYTRKPDGSLEAVTSGDATERAQTFVFRKQQ